MRTQVTWALALAAAGCGGKGSILDELTATAGQTYDPSYGPSGEPDDSGDEPTGGATTGATTGDEPTSGGPPGTGPIDVLFVIDNTGSMADEQSLLAKNIAALVNTERDLRIGITTTDVGNPRCPQAQTTPERGAMATGSCVEAAALGDFSFNMEDFSYACTDVCALASIDVVPTPTTEEPEPEVRPWFERTGGVTNLAEEGLSLVQALQCALPRGVAGCGFESPLESMRMALARAMDASSPEYGFLRREADLVVVILTDEVDCSYNPAFDDIFETNMIFWEDPDWPAPTSAVCFNAGVQCEGAGPAYEACPATNYNIEGEPGVADDEAVLWPVSRYTDLLADIQASKTGGARVRLLAIAGVPRGFETGDAALVFADDPDPEDNDLFGIGPGCVLANPDDPDYSQTARPPVRMLEVGASLGPLEFHSICQNDYSVPLAKIAQP
ncbi:hypothetical protein [Nannocystis punicea]|uniref:VWFA domain-containing protein n=1 Tax=Nannocystis punicea TaxID=2995304 RepID=A0ABY7H8V5_9BACT|nr:hypothetical protein [Nannocystis poenicansa]WAS95464.1 hypothetical protein O0S08_04825 [Nannocystis poenicansa]